MSCPVWKDHQPSQQCNSTGQQAGLDRQVLQGAPILPDTGELVPCLSVSPQPGRQVFCNKEAGSRIHYLVMVILSRLHMGRGGGAFGPPCPQFPYTLLFTSHDHPAGSDLSVLPPAAALASVPLLQPGTISQEAVLPLPLGVVASTSSPALQQTPGAASKADGPLFLSVLFPPIPEKLVTKIRAGSFVDMQELLPDNMALLKQLENLQSDKAKSKAKLREVKMLSSWLYCFLAYIAVATPDKHTRDLLTYARLVMREALRTGGDGWAAYDWLFREHAALDKARHFDWTTLDSGLHQATFICQAGPSGATCTHCAEADHSTKACALASVQDSPGRRDDSPPPAKRARPSQQRPAVPPRPRGEAADKICISRNWGYCIFPRCKMDHICATCKKGDHRAKDCDSTPDDGYYKQWAKSGKGRQP